MYSRSLPRWIMLLGLVLLVGVLLFPLWRITLEAAQFPGGLRLNIWIHKFSGDDGTDKILRNINILNHYIGMKAIEPDAIPELRFFPPVVYLLMGLGLGTAALNRTWAYLIWVVLISALSLLAFYDFYLWMYDYGHNLDPKAPIQVPGQTYMPPLFGSKDLLNFYVRSYPRAGTLFLGLAILSGLLATWLSVKRTSHDRA